MDNLGTLALGIGALTIGAFIFLDLDELGTSAKIAETAKSSAPIERTDAAYWAHEIPAPRVRLPRKAHSRPACKVPPFAETSHTVFVSSYEGNALSNLDLTNGDDVTQLATLDIAPGDTPLVILASAYEPLIYNFIGATERIERVVISPREKGWAVGAIGIPKGKLTKLGANCLPYEYQDEIDMMKAWRETTGLSPSYVNMAYDINRMHVPSGRNLTKRQTMARRARETPLHEIRYNGQYIDLSREDHDLLRFNPEGVHILDPKELVAFGSVRALKLLPGRAGIAQLVGEGTLKLRDGAYYVARPFREYPSGLYGAHQVTFVFPNGMQRPYNKPGHSQVYNESEYARVK